MKVVSYSRISIEDQSQFSIPFQNEQIVNFCQRNNYELIEMFVDKGQSAKNFDRKEWKKLEIFLKQNKGEIDYLIVFKYDRFSRNLAEALIMIQKLEQEYDIKLLSVSEQIPLDPEHPMFFHIRTSTLLNSHHERLVIRQRTMEGMRKALSDGYYIYQAPFGYVNSRDTENKPGLKPDTETGYLIQNIFEWYLNGYSFADITRKLRQKGHVLRGNSTIQRILHNKVYAGYIRSSIGKDTPTYVKGRHLPLVDEDTFIRVQHLLDQSTSVKLEQDNGVTYLKGAIVCPDCGRIMTCSRSKGRTKYYWYYECATHRKSYGVRKAHDTISSILEELTFTTRQIDFLKDVTQKEVTKFVKANFGKLPNLEKQQQQKAEMIMNLEEKFLLGQFDDNSFMKWKVRLTSELKKINSEIELIKSTKQNHWEVMINQFSKLDSIHDVFLAADTVQKREFIRVGFGRQLSWDGSIYRTGYLNPIFGTKLLGLRRLRLLEYEPKKGESLKLPPCSP